MRCSERIPSAWLGACSDEKQENDPVVVITDVFISSIDLAWKQTPGLATEACGSFHHQEKRPQRRSQLQSRGPNLTYHAGEQLPVIIAGHPSGAVELKPAILASPHAQQARVDLHGGKARRSVPGTLGRNGDT